MKHSVFTVAMPDYDVREAAKKLKEWGYDGVEWRVTGVPSPMPETPNFWSANRATVDFENLPGSAEEARKISKEAGLEIPAQGGEHVVLPEVRLGDLGVDPAGGLHEQEGDLGIGVRETGLR